MNRRNFILSGVALTACAPGINDDFEGDSDGEFRGPQSPAVHQWGAVNKGLVPKGATWGSAGLGWTPSLWGSASVEF